MLRESRPSDCVHAAAHAMQPPTAHSPVDLVGSVAKRPQLAPRHDTVLAGGQLPGRPVPRV